MLNFFRKPYVYCITFSLALTLLLAWSLMAVFIIPKELEEPEEEYETIDLSQFTKPQESETESEPTFVLTLPSDSTENEPDNTLEPDESSQESAPETEPVPEAENETEEQPETEPLENEEESNAETAPIDASEQE
jgi:hypothetical protein